MNNNNNNVNTQPITLPRVLDSQGKDVPSSRQIVVHLVPVGGGGQCRELPNYQPRKRPSERSNSMIENNDFSNITAEQAAILANALAPQTGSITNPHSQIPSRNNQMGLIIIRNMNGQTRTIRPDRNGSIQIDRDALNSGKLYLQVDSQANSVELRSVDGGYVKLLPDSQGRIRITSRNGNISIPIDSNAVPSTDNSMNYIPIGSNNPNGLIIPIGSNASDIGRYDAYTGRWSW